MHRIGEPLAEENGELVGYEMAHFKTVKVHIDYHVEVERHRYSVPHALVGQVLEARITAAVVELMHRGQRVASHARNGRQGSFRQQHCRGHCRAGPVAPGRLSR